MQLGSPGVLLDVCYGVPLGRVSHQDMPQQVLAVFADGNAARKVVIHCQDALQDLQGEENNQRVSSSWRHLQGCSPTLRTLSWVNQQAKHSL